MLDSFSKLNTATHACEQVACNEALPPEIRDGLCAAIKAGKMNRAFLMLRTPEEIAVIERTLVELHESAGLAEDLRELKGLLAKICDGLVEVGGFTAPALSALGIDASNLIRVRNSYTPNHFQNVISQLLLDTGEFKRRIHGTGVPTIGLLGGRHQRTTAEALPVAK